MSKYDKHPLIVDVETKSLQDNAEVMDAIFQAQWKAPGNIKDEEKIQAKFEADLASYRSRRALLPGENQIIAISCCCPYDMEPLAIASDNEKEVLEWWLDVCKAYLPQGIRPIGFNIQFDLLSLMFALYRHGLELPRKMSKWDPLDLFYEFGRAGGLKTWAARAGCTLSGVDGSKVSELYEAGEWKKIHDYALEDALNTATLFKVFSTIREL